MSIETRVGPYSRSVRTLIKTRADLATSIKDLKDLRVLRRRAGYRHSGPTDLRDVFSLARAMARDRPSPYGEGVAFFYRSAGACPPRLSGRPQPGEGNPLGCACGIRGPSPYVKGRRFFHRSAGPITATLSDL